MVDISGVLFFFSNKYTNKQYFHTIRYISYVYWKSFRNYYINLFQLTFLFSFLFLNQEIGIFLELLRL